MNKAMLGMLTVMACAAASGASAADNAMQACGAKYQAAKAAKTLPGGQTWNQFLAQCRSGLAKASAAPAPVAKPVAGQAKVVQASAGATAAHDRQRQCGAQWKADKAAGKIPQGQTWPKYWSACNTRLKG